MGNIAEVQPLSLIEALNLNSRTISAALWLAGLVLCLSSAMGLTTALCITEGCKLYHGYGFLGLSLHVWGAVAFGTGLVLLLCPFGRLAVYRRFLLFCIWAEIILLTVQVIYLPCSQCLLVGLLWGLLSLVELRNRLTFRAWLAVFLVASVLMGKEMLHPWPVFGPVDARVKVYFSPSCPGCRNEINKLLAGGEVDRVRVAFFPVALKPGDYERVEAFQNVLKHTLDIPQAFQAFWSETVHAPVGWREWLTVRLGLLRNRMILARMGVNKVPLVVSGSSAGMVTGVPAGNAGAGECGFEGVKDCADGFGPATHPDSFQGIRRDGIKIKDKVSQRRRASMILAQTRTDDVEPLAPDISGYFESAHDEAEPTPQSVGSDEDSHDSQEQNDD